MNELFIIALAIFIISFKAYSQNQTNVYEYEDLKRAKYIWSLYASQHQLVYKNLEEYDQTDGESEINTFGGKFTLVSKTGFLFETGIGAGVGNSFEGKDRDFQYVPMEFLLGFGSEIFELWIFDLNWRLATSTSIWAEDVIKDDALPPEQQRQNTQVNTGFAISPSVCLNTHLEIFSNEITIGAVTGWDFGGNADIGVSGLWFAVNFGTTVSSYGD